MATHIVCDGCGTPCTNGHVERGIYAPKQYCPTCALHQDEAEDEARSIVAQAAVLLEDRLRALGVDV